MRRSSDSTVERLSGGRNAAGTDRSSRPAGRSVEAQASGRPFDRRPRGRGAISQAAALRLGQVEDAEQLLREHEILRPEDLVGPRVIQVGEDDLGVGQELAFEERLALDDRPFGPQVGQRHLVNQLVAGAGDPEELGAGDLRQHDLLGEPPRLADEDPPVCASPSMISEAGITG